MLWTPIVKSGGKGAQYNQINHIAEIGSNIKAKYGVDVEFVVNEKFQRCLAEMRAFAGSHTAELKCPVMRMMQIEEWLGKHVGKRAKALKTVSVV